MTRVVHPIAGAIAFLTIAAFWFAPVAYFSSVSPADVASGGAGAGDPDRASGAAFRLAQGWEILAPLPLLGDSG